MTQKWKHNNEAGIIFEHVSAGTCGEKSHFEVKAATYRKLSIDELNLRLHIISHGTIKWNVVGCLSRSERCSLVKHHWTNEQGRIVCPFSNLVINIRSPPRIGLNHFSNVHPRSPPQSAEQNSVHLGVRYQASQSVAKHRLFFARTSTRIQSSHHTSPLDWHLLEATTPA